jgi:hypothetical protein
MTAWVRQFVVATCCVFAVATGMAATPATPEADRRSEDQTYLTFPEWFLVYSPDEYAVMLRRSYPSEFPWWGHIGQFWSSYGKIIEATRRYPFNAEYHVMINVIGVSTTVEYALRSAYETLVGRVAELLAPTGGTEEDRFAARVAQEYVDFIRVRPWYEFDFKRRLVELWRDVPLRGPGMLRKWERRYALSTELLAKAAYGWLIGVGTQSAYGAASPTTVVVLDRDPGPVVGVKKRSTLDGTAVLAELPRYDAFKDSALAIAKTGASFFEIAGNDSRAPILVTLVTSDGWRPPEGVTILFEQPIVTQPPRVRQGAVVSIGGLAELLRSLGPNVVLEHIYDY